MSLTSLAVILAISSVQLLPIVGVWLGARSLSKRSGLPRFVPRVGYALAIVSALVIVGGSFAGVLHSTNSVAGESGGSSQKARVLAEGISEAMNCGALAFLVAIVGALWLGFCAWKWRAVDRMT